MPDRLGVYPARWPTGSRAPVRNYPVADAAEWGIGALLTLTAGELDEAGADPSDVVGISTGPEPQFLPGHVQGGSLNPDGSSEVYLADDQTVFNWLTVGGPPDESNIGVLYGVVKDTDDIWKVDIAEVTATVVRIVGLDPLDPLRVFARFDSQAAVDLQG